MLNREIPFLRIGIPLCAGIVAGLYLDPGTPFYLISFLILAAGFLVSLSFNRSFTNTVYGITLTLTLFVSGLFLYSLEKAAISDLPAEETYFSGYLSDFPEEKENTFKLIFRIEAYISEGNQRPARGSLLIYHRKDSACLTYLPGDRIIIRCRPVEMSNRGNPYEFDYKFYLENRGIRYYGFTDSSDILRHSAPHNRRIIHRALIIRQKIIGMFRQRGIEGDRLALVAAITLGQKNMLDPEQKQYFMKAGIMHIMAVSGLHAMIISLFIFRMLFFLRGRLNILRVIITLLLLWSFAFVTGLTPSVLRATIMFTFLQAGSLMKRPVNPVNSVLASAFVLILVRPSVIFEAGFLLSYSAVIFIISFYRDFYRKLRFSHRLPDLVWQAAAVSIVAQAGTLPLTVMLFNRFPTWFILSNVIIVPLATLVIITGCLVPLTFPVRFISQPLAYILDHLAGFTEFLTEKAASLPFSTIDNIGLTTTGCILLTIAIFLLMRFFLQERSLPVSRLLAVLLLLILTGSVREIRTRSTNELIVYNSVGHPVVGIRTGKTLYVFSDTLAAGQEVVRHCATLGLRRNHSLLTGAPCLIKADDKEILITGYLNYDIIGRLNPDIVIIAGKNLHIEEIVQPAGRLDALIVASGSDPGYRSAGILRSLSSDTVHFASKEGAFSLRL